MTQIRTRALPAGHLVPLPIVALLVCAAAACGGSDGSGGNGGTGTTPSQTATITAEVKFNNGTSLGTATFTATVGTTVTITVADLKAKGIDTTDLADGYLVARHPPEYGMYGRVVGAFIASTEQNAAHALVLWADRTKQVVIYGLSINYAPDWARAFATPGFGQDMAARELTVRALRTGETSLMENGSIMVTVDGPEADRVAGVDAINAALTLSDGVRVGYMKYVGQANFADAGMGLYSSGLGGAGMHSAWAFGANEVYRSNAAVARMVFYKEGIEMLLRFNNLLGRDSMKTLVDSNYGFITPVGYSYIRAAALFTPTK